MCGIVGFVGDVHAAPILLDGLERLEYRGYDSAGIAVLGTEKISVKKTVGRIQALRDVTNDGLDIPGGVGIGHTRWATHGAPNQKNAHPHMSEDTKFAVVHNGIIENYAELKDMLEKEGVHFSSDTDTEVIPQLLSKFYNGDFLETVRKVSGMLSGSYALGIICTDYPDTLIAVKKFSPLIIATGRGMNYIASDVTALVDHTRDVIYIDDGDFAVLTASDIKFYDAAGDITDKPISRVEWDISSAEKGGYEHFMMKEIHEQPSAFRQTVESHMKNGSVDFGSLLLDDYKLEQITRIFITACGSAYHAGIVGKYIFEELLRIPTEVDLASEFRYRNPIIDEHTLVIVISQSGETADTLAALNEAKSRGAHILSVVNVVGSSIAKASHDVIYTWAGPEIAVATTKGYTTQLAVLYLFAVWCAYRLGTADSKELEGILGEIRRIPEKIQAVIDLGDRIRQMAKHSIKTDSLFFIGRNIDYAVALESSLKLKEISYTHSEAYAAGELKHGTISLIEEGKTVIALAAYDRLTDKLASNIREVKARGAFVVACADEENTSVGVEADEVIFIPKTHHLLSACIEVVPFQLYAYFVAQQRGCDIDKPRNLAKSVTVE